LRADRYKKEVMVMKEESENRKRSIVAPVLIGSVAAAGIALLLAPKTGKEVRKDLKRFATNTRNQVAEVIDEGRELYEEGREVVAGAVKAGRERYDAGTERLMRLMHKKERSLVAPILAGGIIGAAVALLLAPKLGKEVRSDLMRIAGSSRDKLVSAIDKGMDLYRERRKAAPEAVEEGKKVSVQESEKLRPAA
jgi:gas vesicle protein